MTLPWSRTAAMFAAFALGQHAPCRETTGRRCDNRRMQRASRPGSALCRMPMLRVVLPLALALTGCMGVTTVNGPVGAPAVAEAGLGCERAEAFTFAGESTLEAVGLTEYVAEGEDGRRGMVWITADAIDDFGLGGLRPDARAAVTAAGIDPVLAEPQRIVCVQWIDGSGMAGPLPEGWELPSDLAPEGVAAETGPPLVLIGLLAAAALIVAVSFLAFRGDRAQS